MPPTVPDVGLAQAQKPPVAPGFFAPASLRRAPTGRNEAAEAAMIETGCMICEPENLLDSGPFAQSTSGVHENGGTLALCELPETSRNKSFHFDGAKRHAAIQL